MDKRRDGLFEHLDKVLRLAEKKISVKRGKKESDLQAWSRIIVYAVGAYAKVLETEELEQRVEKLEEIIKNGVVIPNEKP